jgi:DNA-binding NarL/FixJ family response regulator
MENEKRINLIIIEDNALFATALKQYLLTGFEKIQIRANIQMFKNSETCLDWISHIGNIKPDIIIMDYFLNSQYNESVDGLKAMFNLKLVKPNAEVIFLSSQDKVEVAVEALRMGAFNYIVKNEHSFKNVFESIKECIGEIKFAEKINRN